MNDHASMAHIFNQRHALTYLQYICSEISEAQDRFTNLLQRIYLNQPNDREIVRLLMTHVGRGGQGDVGQRIRDEILVIQVFKIYLVHINVCIYYIVHIASPLSIMCTFSTIREIMTVRVA